MFSLAPGAIVTVPLPLMKAIVAVEFTVILKGVSTSTSSVVAGTIPPGQGAFTTVEDQLPLPAATICAARPFEAKSRSGRIIRIKKFVFVLMIVVSWAKIKCFERRRLNGLMPSHAIRLLLHASWSNPIVRDG